VPTWLSGCPTEVGRDDPYTLLMAVKTDLVTGAGRGTERAAEIAVAKYGKVVVFGLDPANHQDIYKKAWRQ
jgi:hypothetical protein